MLAYDAGFYLFVLFLTNFSADEVSAFDSAKASFCRLLHRRQDSKILNVEAACSQLKKLSTLLERAVRYQSDPLN